MRILVTNDDGVDAPGIRALARAVAALGHDLVVVAPLADHSGASSAIGALGDASRLRVEPRAWGELDGRVVGLDGPPALCVISACLGAFGPPPDLVVSGINAGLNTGRSILHSGTIGAALTAANFAISGLAVSIEGKEPSHWESAGALAAEGLRWLTTAPPRTAVNLNVPDRPLPDIDGVRWAEPAPIGQWHATVAEVTADHLTIGLARTEVELPPASDTAVVAAGCAAFTLLNPPSPVPPEAAGQLGAGLQALVGRPS